MRIKTALNLIFDVSRCLYCLCSDMHTNNREDYLILFYTHLSTHGDSIIKILWPCTIMVSDSNSDSITILIIEIMETYCYRFILIWECVLVKNWRGINFFKMG